MSHEQTLGVALDALFSPAGRTGVMGATVTGCTSDWRKVQPGDAFVAILDDSADGHDVAARAVQRGAVAVIAERMIPVFDAPVYYVEDTRVALGELCHALVDNPSRRLRVIGVVGTQGKSTVVPTTVSSSSPASLPWARASLEISTSARSQLVASMRPSLAASEEGVSSSTPGPRLMPS